MPQPEYYQQDWTVEEVQQACALVGEANIYLSQLKSLEEKR